MRIGNIVGFMVIFGLLAGCGKDGKWSEAALGEDCGGRWVLAVPEAPTARAVTEQGAAGARLAGELRGLSVGLLKALGAGEGQNVLVSPVSVAGAMGLLAADAQGVTATELQGLLAPGGSLSEFVTDFAAYSADLEAPPATRHALVTRGQAVYFREGNEPGGAWKQAAGDGVLVEKLDGNFERARQDVNEWVFRQSSCLIEDLVPKGGISEETATILLDVVAVLADWDQPFELRSAEDFELASGARSSVDMLHGVREVLVGEVAGNQVVRLPTLDGTLDLVVVLPPESDGLPGLIAGLDAEGLAAMLAPGAVQRERRDVYLPGLDLRVTTPLEQTLITLGLESLGGVPEVGSLCVSCSAIAKVQQLAVLRLDEQGFRASAATEVWLTDTGSPFAPELRIDRPFLVMVVDREMRVPLFVGAIHEL